MKLNDGQPHYLCANADEGEPGTFKDRWILEHAPHLLIESMLIAAYALQVRHAFVYIRGEFDLPYRRLAGAVEEAYDAGLLGERILGTGFACDIIVYPRRGLVRLRRGVGAARLGRRQARLSAQPAAAAHREGPLPAADGRQQRRDALQRRRDHRQRRRGVQQVGTPKCPGTQLVSISGHIDRPGVYEVEYGYPLDEVPVRGLRRHHRRQEAQVHRPRRHLDQGADRRRDRAAHLRQAVARRRRLVARLGRHDRHRRRHVHGAPAAGDAALLPPRVVRPVHAVPRRHGLDAPDHRPHRRRRRPARGHRRG